MDRNSDASTEHDVSLDEETAFLNDVERGSSEAVVGSGDQTHRRECWICRDEETQENPLVSPCACSGSLDGIHMKCLVRWLEMRGDVRPEEGSQRGQCEVCHSNYRIVQKKVIVWQWELLCSCDSLRSIFEMGTIVLITLMFSYTMYAVYWVQDEEKKISSFSKVLGVIFLVLCVPLTIATIFRIFSRWKDANSVATYFLDDVEVSLTDVWEPEASADSGRQDEIELRPDSSERSSAFVV